ncbi:fatty acid desaturase [Dongia sp.]|uniref:fatty acid desaturase n=1 Tax=Dongia sp. TaxID=1977262 RepID=UPI0035B122C9
MSSAASISALQERSDAKGLVHLAGHLALLLATGYLVARAQGWWLLPAALFHGIVLIFLFAPLHETVHRTAFKSRWLNDGIAFAIGLLLILPRDYFRAFHFAHHRHTQDPARDPELSSPRPATRGQWLLYVSGLPYWRWQIQGLVMRALGKVGEEFYGNNAQRQKVVAESRLVIAIYAAILIASLVLESDVAWRYWLLPALLGQPFLRLYLLAEHWGCPLSPADSPIAMLLRSRTTYTNRAMRFLAWNMPFHAEHHAFPALPFHALPRANDLVRDQLGTTSPGYLAATGWILARLKA